MYTVSQTTTMQTVDEQLQLQSHEDLIAEKILKRAEIARITRQLKAKLFKAGMKVREGQGKAPSSSSPTASSPVNENETDQGTSTETATSTSPATAATAASTSVRAATTSNATTNAATTSTKETSDNTTAHSLKSMTPLKRKTTNFDDMRPLSRAHSHLEDIDDDFSSPVKRMHQGNIPSSPFYSTNNTSPASFHIINSQPSSAQKPPLSSHYQHHHHQQQQHQQQHQQQPPKTPPFTHRFANLDEAALNKTPSPLKDDPSQQSGSAKHALQSALLSTPKTSKFKKSIEFKTPNSRYHNDNEEGADLLLYMSNSPARPVTSSKDTKELNVFLNIPTTPKSSSVHMLQTPSMGLESTPPRNSLSGLPFSTPSISINGQQQPTTPNLSSAAILHDLTNTPTSSHRITGANGNGNTTAARNNISSTIRFQTPGTPNNNVLIPGHHRQVFGNKGTPSTNAMLANGNKTPAFSMSDYVNIFTPSPARHTRTPEFSTHNFVKPSILSYSKELNGVMSGNGNNTNSHGSINNDTNNKGSKEY